MQVENIDFSDDYERSIALRMKAEVEVKTREQMLQTEKAIEKADKNNTKTQKDKGDQVISAVGGAGRVAQRRSR